MATRTGDESKALRPNWLRRRLAKWALLPYRLGLGPLLSKRVMILTAKGRLTGKERKTPLWYVRDGDTVYCLSGWGSSSHWLRNLVASPNATVQIGKERWQTEALLVPEPPEGGRVLNMFLEKYGGRTVRLFYHLDRLVLVTFQLNSRGSPPL